MSWKHVTVAALCTLTVTAGELTAAVSKPYQEWRDSAIQFLLSSDEKKQWRALKTDDQAREFVDLFWARRDPSPGTPRNEFYEEFLGRVAYADENFSERSLRGSVSERGRVFVTLGPPPSAGIDARRDSTVVAKESTLAGSENMAAARDMGAKDTWYWPREEALKLFGLGKVEVVFIEDPVTRRVLRDPTRADFIAAERAALTRQMVSPQLATLPDWALVGGLTPRVRVPAVQTRQVPVTTEVTSVTVIEEDPGSSQPLASREEGASKLTLLNDVFSITTETSTDPFTTFRPVGTFRASDDLGWVTQYCSRIAEVPTLRFTLRIFGKAGSQNVNRATDPDEMMPDKLKAVPGCYLLRGVVPLSGMAAGSYDLEVKIEDPATSKTHTVQQAFVIE